MSQQEARELIDQIKEDARGDRSIGGAHCHQLANGEWVVRCTRPESMHFWSLEDFRAWQHERAA